MTERQSTGSPQDATGGGAGFGPEIGIVGYGAFGRLAAGELGRHTRIVVHDPALARGPIAEEVEAVSLERVAEAGVVVLAVPVQAIRSVCRALAPVLESVAGRKLVADVASVKAGPIRWMVEELPAGVEILGTHPLFGPQTARERGTIVGEPIAVCPVRVGGDTFERARRVLAGALGLRVVEMDAEEHDRQMGYVQAVTHLVSHAVRDLGLPAFEASTQAYRRLLQMRENTASDSAELFDAIQRLNPHAGAARSRFLEAVLRVVERAEEARPGSSPEDLERELLEHTTRRSRARVETLLHEDFVEVCSDGTVLGRGEIVEQLGAEAPVDRRVLEMTTSYPSRDCAVVMYVVETRDGGEARVSRRTSLWLKTATGWRMRHHQGTPMARA